MSELTFAGLSSMLSRHGDDLLYQTNLILETVCNYWGKSHTKHSLTTFKFEKGTLEITIPQCRFSCFSETKLIFNEGEILSQVTFFVEKNGEQQPFHDFFLNTDGVVNYGSPKRSPDVSWDNARNVEEHFMNELIQSASKAGLF
ncbi:hypothetical protein POU31_13275 [Escherichia coli]|uniref:hypothetical protein n=1 Tax=Escherichia coli TaxID=562 RepID=UPI0017630701|nr:hypothetical protein [Escherichia coli]EIK0414770.1 hypothetical protein [Escherichia coli]MCN3350606.1 hypothetical protein [Escherichia coli]MCN5432932.1 hypothetical protein [Escherichia coli]HAI5186261.1 hypothetical protein [Escherichia coli]HAJ5261924.1 hypothetical protein [Escherichia coli]